MLKRIIVIKFIYFNRALISHLIFSIFSSKKINLEVKKQFLNILINILCGGVIDKIRSVLLRVKLIDSKFRLRIFKSKSYLFYNTTKTFTWKLFLFDLRNFFTSSANLFWCLIFFIIYYSINGEIDFYILTTFFCISIITRFSLSLCVALIGNFYLITGKFEISDNKTYTFMQSFILKQLGQALSKVESKSLISDKSLRYKLLKITNFLFSQKTNNEIFIPINSDWNEEYFEALFKKEDWKARWINVRYTYAFLTAMWMKSPIGDLIEFVRKFAK